MRYDLRNPLKRKNFSLAVKKAWNGDSVVDFSVVKHRTLNQNSYLHVALTYLAKEYGETPNYVKQVLYKRIWNKDIFLRRKYDERLGTEIEYWRSSRELSVEEMRESIENMRNGASKDMGIYIPSADEKSLVEAMERETW